MLFYENEFGINEEALEERMFCKSLRYLAHSKGVDRK